jgi:hypothetical protein
VNRPPLAANLPIKTSFHSVTDKWAAPLWL